MRKSTHKIGRVAVVGSGNVGHHISVLLHGAGVEVSHVFSRTLSRAQDTASIVGAKALDNLDDLPTNCGAVLICTPDDSIKKVADQIARTASSSTLIAHTSGNTSIEAIRHPKRGVLWPIYSFVRASSVDLNLVPIIIDADTSSLEQMYNLAARLSAVVEQHDDNQRKRLHVAAVLASNMTVHLLQQSSDYLNTYGLSADLLKPLVIDAVDRRLNTTITDSLTGPARRGDYASITEHIDLLTQDQLTLQLYTDITRSILAKYADQHNQKFKK